MPIADEYESPDAAGNWPKEPVFDEEYDYVDFLIDMFCRWVLITCVAVLAVLAVTFGLPPAIYKPLAIGAFVLSCVKFMAWLDTGITELRRHDILIDEARHDG